MTMIEQLGKRWKNHVREKTEGIPAEIGKMDDSGEVIAVLVEGVQNEVYARLYGDRNRLITAINMCVDPRARLPIRVRHNQNGRYVILGVDETPATEFLGESAPAANIGPMDGNLNKIILPSHKFEPGRIRSLNGTDLQFHMEELSYGSSVLGNTDGDASTAVSTITSDNKALIVVSCNPADNTLTSTKGDDTPLGLPLTREDGMAVEIPVGDMRLWGYIIPEGSTALPTKPLPADAAYEFDLRSWITPTMTLAEMDANPTIQNVRQINFPNGTLTDNGDGSVDYVPTGGSGSLSVDDGTTTVDPTSTLHFNPSFFDVTDAGGDEADVTLVPDTDGTLAANSDAKVPSQKAVKSYVDQTVLGLSAKADVRLATAAALATNTYSNGVSGVGATLTGVATGVLTVDGVTVALNDRILVKNEAAQANNGIYKCTVAGAIGVAYVLTRTTDGDTDAELRGSWMFSTEGTANAGQGWLNTNTSAITFGTTAITFGEFSAGAIQAGTGLTKTGNTLAIDSTVATLTGSQTLTNKTLTSPTINTPTITVNDASLTIQDDADTTKKLKFQASGITTSTTRTLTAPDADTTIVGTDNTQTLTNKKLVDASTTIVDDGDNTKAIKFQASGITTGTTRTATMPDADLTIVGTTTTQTLTGKTIDGDDNTIQDVPLTAIKTNASNTKRFITRDASGVITDATSPAFDNAAHNHTNAANGGQITDAALSAAVGISKGGTGQTTRQAAMDALSPTSNDGELLIDNGTNVVALTGALDHYTLECDTDVSPRVFWNHMPVVPFARVGLGSDSTISISSIPTGWSHIELILKLRSDRAGQTNDGINMTFNNDTGSNYHYDYQRLSSGGAAAGTNADAGTGIKPDVFVTAATAPSDYYASVRILILDYTVTAHNRHVIGQAEIPRVTTVGDGGMLGAVWKNTADEISSIQIAPLNGTNFKAGSTYEVRLFK